MIEIIVKPERELYTDVEWLEIIYGKERIVRCKDCKFYAKTETMWDTDEWCTRCKDDDTGVFEVESDGFCKWGVRKDG